MRERWDKYDETKTWKSYSSPFEPKIAPPEPHIKFHINKNSSSHGYAYKCRLLFRTKIFITTNKDQKPQNIPAHTVEAEKNRGHRRL